MSNNNGSAISRRGFMSTVAGAGIGLACAPFAARALAEDAKPFRISLAQWSLHRKFFGENRLAVMEQLGGYGPYMTALRDEPEKVLVGDLDPLDFASYTREQFDIGAVEYVNQFFLGKARDEVYLAALKQRAEDAGVKSLLIMCDSEGDLGAPDTAARNEAVENHYKWVDAAAFLGCHSIRVNARSDEALSHEEQADLVVDGLGRLGDYGAAQGIGVIVENHGGTSSNAAWLAGVMTQIGSDNVGTLPDFGNFQISPTEHYDNYLGVKEMMPFAKAVSAKTYAFDPLTGQETTLDYKRLMQAVVDAGYHGYVGIEYEGDGLEEDAGIRATKALLEKVMLEV